MGKLAPDDYEKFTQMLEALEPELKNLKDTPRQFVEDQIGRNEQYGEGTFVSVKQFNWLKELYIEHAAPDAAEATKRLSPSNDDGPRSDDMDDEIPF